MCTHALLYFAVSFIATKKWMQMHDLAKAYKATHDNLDVSSTDKENTALFKWSKNPLDQFVHMSTVEAYSLILYCSQSSTNVIPTGITSKIPF